MAFQQALSGLSSFSKALDVVSNNVANAATVGYKSGQTLFADLYANAMVGGGNPGLQIGMGSNIPGVRQNFSQGGLTASANPLDMAINGGGFFRMQRMDGSVAYSRNGQFDVDKNGNIINGTGERLMGFPVLSQAPAVFGGTPQALRIDTANVNPKSTENVAMTLNLDARAVNPTTLTPPAAAFDTTQTPPDPTTYNFATSVQVFDSLGNPHTLNAYFVRADPQVDRNWDVYISHNGGESVQAGTLNFDEFGVIDPATSTLQYTLTPANAAGDPNGAADPQDMVIEFGSTTQFGAASAVTDLNQDGYSTGQFIGLSVSKDGIVEGRYSNGQTQNLGQIAMANFRAPNGLVSLGNNLWGATPDSGPEVVGAAGTGGMGGISSGMVEESNVDLTQELVQMIINQRNYQANAQSIRTQDQILQTLVNLR